MADRSWWRCAVRVGCAGVALIAAASLHAFPAGACELLTVAVIRLGLASGQFFSKPPGYYFFQVYANTAQTQTQITGFNPAGITGDIVLRIDFHEPSNLLGSMVSLDGGTNFASFATQVGFFNTPLAGRAFALGRMLSGLPTTPAGPFGAATC